MRIAYVVTNFPPVSETFIRREAGALCDAGHRVFVYTNRRHRNAEIEGTLHAGLTVHEVPFASNVHDLAVQAGKDGIEHLHGSLMFNAHRAAFKAAVRADIPFSLRVYGGYDVFSRRDPDLYRDISRHPLCDALIVEDEFMRHWIVNRLGAEPLKVEIVGNSFDLERYRLSSARTGTTPTILTIARLVEKKGLIHLVEAFQQLSRSGVRAKLRIAGSGPEESSLRAAAAGNPRIEFLGEISEARCREEYAAADVFCLPCIRARDGDADGIPTTILEAMSFELPIVTSDLMGTSFYVRHGVEGALSPPGNSDAICYALQQVCANRDLRMAMGQNGRTRVHELCELKRNVARMERIFLEARHRRWWAALDALLQRRTQYTPEVERLYEEKRRNAIQFLRPQGRMIDIGCGDGDVRSHVSPETRYVGCDPVPIKNFKSDFPFIIATGEALPFKDDSFDSALLYSVLSNALDVDAMLSDAFRVLKPGGKLLLYESVNAPNPLHLNHFTAADLQNRVAERFKTLDSKADGPHYLLLRAEKPAVINVATVEPPLVSIAITTHNREQFLSRCIDSVLRQTYQPIELVIVDDGSTDNTGRMLQRYSGRLRVIRIDHQGLAVAKNVALRATSSMARYVGILDSDDFYHPEFVERCVQRLEADSGVGLVYTDDIVVDARGRVLAKRQAIDPWNIDTWLRTLNLRGDTWLARRDLVMQTCLHDEALSRDVDYDLFYQLLELTTFAHLTGYLVYIRQHNGQATRDRLELAKCHAANLVKYGYSPEYAYLRARRNPEWTPAIEAGIELGKQLRARRGVNQ